MVDILRIESNLFWKQIGVSERYKKIQYSSVIIAILIVIKYLTTLPTNTFPLKELFALTIAFLGFFKIQTDTISKKQTKMMTFFPMLDVKEIKNYYLYKRPFFVYVMMFYLLFPINFSPEEVLGFFFFLSVIMFMMFIDTLTYRLFSNSEIPNRVNTIIRISYFVIFAGYLYIDVGGFVLKDFILSLDLWYLVFISLFFSSLNPFILTYPNRKENEDD